MTTRNLLVELFVEELPPKALKKLGEAFGREIRQGLVNDLLTKPDNTWAWFATPRRLAVRVNDVSSKQQPRKVVEKLMPVSVAFDTDGNPTPALLKRMKAKGFGSESMIDFERRMEGKTEVLFYAWTEAGFALSQVLGDVLEAALAKLPIPKVMTYQLRDGWTDVKFVRPAHGLVVLHGNEVVQGVRSHANSLILGLEPGRETKGHRFESTQAVIQIDSADSYETQLRDQGGVVASFTERRAEIVRQLQAAAATLGLTPIDDAALLDEVTALVERPNVLVCQFEPEFLAVPPECLILTMKANQKYFPLLDAAGKLTNRFLVVSNIRPADPSRVIEGNERVVRPRLSDAKFFFDQDRKKTLESRVAGLDKVVYHGKLGSQGERVARVRAIATAIAKAAFPHEALLADVDRAALLAKADLVTDMVGEFPELQGVMGGYYALHDNESVAVAEAIEDHYKPRFAGDSLPRGRVGLVVALADKLETLVGLFGIGQLPTGDKDPFALRRHALGVIRMLIEANVPIALDQLVALSLPAFGSRIDDPSAPLLAFVQERLAGSLRDQGYSAQEVDAVLSLNPQRLSEVGARLAAVRAFALMPEAASLAAANKRVGNILKKVDGAVSAQVDAALLKEPAETALNAALAVAKPQADAAFERGDYAASLQALAALKTPVDAFFDGVMVNAEDPALRANRLGLLATLHAAMNRVADLSKLAS